MAVLTACCQSSVTSAASWGLTTGCPIATPRAGDVREPRVTWNQWPEMVRARGEWQGCSRTFRQPSERHAGLGRAEGCGPSCPVLLVFLEEREALAAEEPVTPTRTGHSAAAETLCLRVRFGGRRNYARDTCLVLCFSLSAPRGSLERGQIPQLRGGRARARRTGRRGSVSAGQGALRWQIAFRGGVHVP